jgi:hypothetical protein
MIKYFCDGCKDEVRAGDMSKFEFKIELPTRRREYHTGRATRTLCLDCQNKVFNAVEEIVSLGMWS